MVWCQYCRVIPSSVDELEVSVYGLVPVLQSHIIYIPSSVDELEVSVYGLVPMVRPPLRLRPAGVH